MFNNLALIFIGVSSNIPYFMFIMNLHCVGKKRNIGDHELLAQLLMQMPQAGTCVHCRRHIKVFLTYSQQLMEKERRKKFLFSFLLKVHEHRMFW